MRNRLRSVDLKTLVIGILLGVCLTLAVGRAKAKDGPRGAAAKDPAANAGRYQITAIPIMDNGRQAGTIMYVLDTQTNAIVSYSSTNRWSRQEEFTIDQ